jgi:hypothetical protein
VALFEALSANCDVVSSTYSIESVHGLRCAQLCSYTQELSSEKQEQQLDMDEAKDTDAQVLVEDDDAKLRSLGITPVLDRSV